MATPHPHHPLPAMATPAPAWHNTWKPKLWDVLTTHPACAGEGTEYERALRMPRGCFVMARDIATDGAKTFGLLQAPPAPANMTATHKYEVLRSGLPWNFMVDYEEARDEEYGRDMRDITQIGAVIALLDQGVRDVYRAIFNGEYAGDMQIMEACGADKFSLHAKWNIPLNGWRAARAFAEDLVTWAEGRDLPGIDTTVYTPQRCMRMLGQSKKGSDRVLKAWGDSSADYRDHLVGVYDEKVMPLVHPRMVVMPVRAAPVAEPTEDITRVKAAVACLSVARASDYMGWLNVGIAIFNVGDAEIDFLDVWDEWSKSAPRKYKADACAKKWGTFGRGNIGMGSLMLWAREDNPELARNIPQREEPEEPLTAEEAIARLREHTAARRARMGVVEAPPVVEERAPAVVDVVEAPVMVVPSEVHEEFVPVPMRGKPFDERKRFWEGAKDDIHASDQGFMRIFVENFKDDIKVNNPTADGDCYIYSKAQKLWKKRANVFVKTEIADYIERYILEFSRFLTEAIEVTRDKGARDTLIDENFQAMKVLKTVRTSSKNTWDKVLVKLFDDTFAVKMNKVANLIPVKNGNVVNLRTGAVIKRTKEMLFSYACDVEYTPDADMGRVTTFFNQVMNGDAALVEYFQKTLGYGLTGEISEREFYVWYGGGANGKGSIAETLRLILGDFYVTSEKALFIKPTNRNHNGGNVAAPHMVALMNGRFATFSEVCEGDELNESDLKRITGGDSITARMLYGNPVTFKTQAKLYLQTNYKPTFTVEDQAMKDRLRYIPFNARFCVDADPTKGEIERDPAVVEWLRSQEGLNKVFTWIVNGAVKWYADGFGELPPVVKDFTRAAYAELDSVFRFVTEKMEKREAGREYNPAWVNIKGADLKTAYGTFCTANALKKLGNKGYGESIMKHIGVATKQEGVMVYVGWRLTCDA